jgi:hypothetical protein
VPSLRELSLAAALCASLSACSTPLIGSGTVAHEVRTPGPFSEIEVSGDFDVTVDLGEARHEVAIDADANLVAEIRSVANGKRLVVDTAREVKPSRRVKLAIAAPDTALVRTSGSSAVKVVDVANERFRLELNGSGNVEASGTTAQLHVFLVGSAQVHLEKLAVSGALANVDGSGSVELAEPKLLEAEVRGSGTIRYAGTPKITGQWIHGSGRVVHR